MSTKGKRYMDELSSEKEARAQLQSLYYLLRQRQASWRTFDLIVRHSYLSGTLREMSPDGELEEDSTALINDTATLVKQTYQCLADFIPKTPKAALRHSDMKKYISHVYLWQFVSFFTLPIQSRMGRKPVVSISIPNGPLLAAVCLAVTNHYIAAPITPDSGPQQFQRDVLQAGADCILTTRDYSAKLGLEGGWTRKHGITVLLVALDDNMRIEMESPKGEAIASGPPLSANAPDDIALILFTSGTAGNKKIVPISTHSIVAGAAFVIDSWALTEEDVCLNMMPLWHVGGLVRNIFAPIFAGGSTICCTAFDPNCFWDVIETSLPTWYYASPSMHNLILAESENRQDALKKSKVRFVCNAAGGLLPSLAQQLHDTFNCLVLPSYGMTECMPISTPPLDYKLDRPGTSGLSTGPQVSILDHNFLSVSRGTIGCICVRGEPLFSGYLQANGRLDTSAFSEDGWFDTGDLGYMDDDGFLYITGRSKEVINRGGELISPFEVENAIVAASSTSQSPLEGRISQALAFSVQHDVLQEAVGVVLVTPTGVPRPDLRLLHSSLKASLQRIKWPELIVYMDDLPRKNNKVLRIKLAERLSLSQLTDDVPYRSRHWEGLCPKPDTDLSVPITCSACNFHLDVLEKEIARVLPTGCSFSIISSAENKSGNEEMVVILAPSDPEQYPLDERLARQLKERLFMVVDGYMVPQKTQILHHPLSTDDAGGRVDMAHIEPPSITTTVAEDESSIEDCVNKAFASVLNLTISDLAADRDFFDLGGDSIKVGRLLSVLRSEFSIPIPIDAILKHNTPSALSAYISGRLRDVSDLATKCQADSFFAEGCEESRSSNRPLLMALQLLPMCIFYPMRRSYQWTIFMLFLSLTQDWVTARFVYGRLFNLALAILVARLTTMATAPWIGIAAKWILIGRFKAGVYPMWGPYHTRWWMVQKIVDICGHGLFAQTSNTNVLYLRLMGAKIGHNVSLCRVSTGEWDLIEIEDGAVLEHCTLRPFAGERNTSMYLGKIHVGRNAIVGTGSIVAPGTSVLEYTCIGPNSSSWEVDDAADKANRNVLPSKVPSAHWTLEWLVTKPLVMVGWIVSLMPWFAGLVGLVLSEPIDTPSPLYSILMWFAATRRVGFHYLALALRTSLSPFILFGFVVVVRGILNYVFGAMQPGPVKGRSQLQTWRMSLMNSIFPNKRLHDLTELMGQHYEGTSIALRMLGGRIGKRVYWPGTGPSIGDYHLLDIGNDVVFGSRAHLITSDCSGSETIRVESRAMIADRVTLLPGVTIGERTTMGSGALTRRNAYYAKGGTYIGSKRGDAFRLSTGEGGLPKDGQRPAHSPKHTGGLGFEASDQRIVSISSTEEVSVDKNVEEAKQEDASPFGRAFYLKQAPYRVYGMATIILYSMTMTTVTALYWNIPTISSIQIVALLIRGNHVARKHEKVIDIPSLYGLFFVFIALLTTLQSALATALVVGAKWYLLGRRQPGNYDWDKSPFCQRWQLYLGIEKLRRYCFRGHGILGMLTGTHWLVLYFRALGGTIGDNCALFANGRPSLMFTEPDLVTVGDRTVIDDASVVGHINTRGRFDLNRLDIGARCVLRTGSRLLSGAVMMDDSALLEHTLVMSGDVVEKGWTMQGWPAERFRGRRVRFPPVCVIARDRRAWQGGR